jgi:hypothetical protein
MMNEHGKSDDFVVPVKLSNKAERSAAEMVEGRESAKGNLLERNTRRTQSRIDVSHALEWIRRAAQAPMRQSLRTQTIPEAGARCVSSARRDLCGGRPARAVPTATRAKSAPAAVGASARPVAAPHLQAFDEENRGARPIRPLLSALQKAMGGGGAENVSERSRVLRTDSTR